MVLWDWDRYGVWLDLFYAKCCWLQVCYRLTWWLIYYSGEIQDGFIHASATLAKTAEKLLLLAWFLPLCEGSETLLEGRDSSLARAIVFLSQDSSGLQEVGASLSILLPARLRSSIMQSVDQIYHEPARLSGMSNIYWFISILKILGSSFTSLFQSTFGIKYSISHLLLLFFIN